MSAPTPAPGDESPREGYYPDPSIPGYVRYWNGASWVPGTSRPAPPQAEPSAAPAAPGPPAPRAAPVDETGPMYFDEAEAPDEAGRTGGVPDATGGNRPEPATAWQADTSRQTGFGDQDRRVSWGGGPDPRAASPAPSPATPAAPEPGPRDPAPAALVPYDSAPSGPVHRDVAPPAPDPSVPAPADPRRPAAPGPARVALPGMRDGGSGTPGTAPGAGRPDDAGPRPPTEGTVTIRAVGRGGTGTPQPREDGAPPAEGTMTMRALPPTPAPQAPERTPRAPDPVRSDPQGPVRNPAPGPVPAPARNSARAPSGPTPPQLPAPAGPPDSWPRQVHQLARPEQTPAPQQPHAVPARHRQTAPPEGQQPVTPWKPPVDDPFQQLARAQAAARPAGLGKRLAARLLDTVVLGALVGAVGFPLATRALDHVDRKIDAAKQTGETVTVWLLDSTTAGLLGAVVAAFLVLGFLLEALPTAKWGRTLGKRLCGVEVRDIESHGPPTVKAALRRWLVYGVLGLLVVGVVNVLWCLIDRPWRQCWHDKAAHTFVAG
ncbi:RDD family protein [Streptomyces halstedii]|uniref:RDD family protein n=1 Tax=Streptomyces halstedii TaxID=1944 RepID=A0ABS6TL49_STRHA|nr:RDD family protein [Streptomyces halstedii]MBV7669001.1 RDD family protein [Streptomyces halstedii]